MHCHIQTLGHVLLRLVEKAELFGNDCSSHTRSAAVVPLGFLNKCLQTALIATGPLSSP